MSYDVARGGYTKSKKVNGDKNRHYNDGYDAIKESNVDPKKVERYLKRGNNPKQLEGSLIKKRPGKKITGRDKKSEAFVAMQQKKMVEGAVAAAEAEILDTAEGGFIEPENEMERTYKLKQEEIKTHLDEQVRCFWKDHRIFLPFKG